MSWHVTYWPHTKPHVLQGYFPVGSPSNKVAGQTCVCKWVCSQSLIRQEHPTHGYNSYFKGGMPGGDCAVQITFFQAADMTIEVSLDIPAIKTHPGSLRCFTEGTLWTTELSRAAWRFVHSNIHTCHSYPPLLPSYVLTTGLKSFFGLQENKLPWHRSSRSPSCPLSCLEYS